MQNTSHNEMKKVVSKLMKDNPKYKENLKDLLSVYLDPYGYIYRTQVYHQLKDLKVPEDASEFEDIVDVAADELRSLGSTFVSDTVSQEQYRLESKNKDDMEIIQDEYTTINHLICLSDSDETIDNLVDLFFKHYFIDERDELENDVVSYLEDEINGMICKSTKELYITTRDLINMYEAFEL
mgnify:FL=1